MFRDETGQLSERSDAGHLIVREVAGFVKRVVRSEAKVGGQSEERGVGKWAQSLAPPHHGRDQGREFAGDGPGSANARPLDWPLGTVPAPSR